MCIRDRYNVKKIALKPSSMDRLESVSYTHLDVYKRQVEDAANVTEEAAAE